MARFLRVGWSMMISVRGEKVFCFIFLAFLGASRLCVFCFGALLLSIIIVILVYNREVIVVTLLGIVFAVIKADVNPDFSRLA